MLELLLFPLLALLLLLLVFAYMFYRGQDGTRESPLQFYIRRVTPKTKVEEEKEEEEPLRPSPPYLESLISTLKEFDPRWFYSPSGKAKLPGGEVGTNLRLSRYLENRGYYTVTEAVLRQNKRADILVDNRVIIEAKPHLTNSSKKGSLMSELQMHSRYKSYDKVIVVYGDARKDVLKELHFGLKSLTGRSVPIIVLGKVTEKYG